MHDEVSVNGWSSSASESDWWKTRILRRRNTRYGDCGVGDGSAVELYELQPGLSAQLSIIEDATVAWLIRPPTSPGDA